MLNRQALITSGIDHGPLGIAAHYGPTEGQDGTSAMYRADDLDVTLLGTPGSYGRRETTTPSAAPWRGYASQIVVKTEPGDCDAGGYPDHILAVIDGAVSVEVA